MYACIEQEGVDAAIPRHIHERDQPLVRIGADVAKAAREHLCPIGAGALAPRCKPQLLDLLSTWKRIVGDPDQGSCLNPSAKPLSDTGMPMPSSGVLNTTNIAVLPSLSCFSSASSITTSATQPLGRQRTNATRPMSVPSMLRPSPLGKSTPSGARTRSSRAFWSAVLSTMTLSPTFGWSSAVTFWMIAHCSKLAPGGVSQLICQSPYCAFTTP